MPTKLVRGFGINDVEYVIQKKESKIVDGKRKQKTIWVCPYYEKWQQMLVRCYDKKYQNKYPTYKDCTLHPSWLYLSNFKAWVDEQPNKDWMSCNLDKDLLVEGNKHYSPSTCVFVDKKVNSFIIDGAAKRGKHMLGVCWNKRDLCYVSRCSDPFKTESGYLGYFDSELEAHLTWKRKKCEYACKLADLQRDERVANALRTKYASNNDLTCK